jgi:hypothetical protein
MLNRKMIKFSNVIKDIKDYSNEKWLCKYQKITRGFFNEDFELVNREARDALQEFNGQNIKNNAVNVNLNLI